MASAPSIEAHPAGAPTSPLFSIRDTSHSGRGVFANQHIPAGTPLSVANDLKIHVLFREYRRETCGHCFAYDRGVEWKIRDNKRGFAFCSETCHTSWQEHNGEAGMAAWEAVERLIKNRSKEDIELVDADCPQPRTAEIEAAWSKVEKQASFIRLARQGSTLKAHRKAMQHAIAAPISADILPLLLSAALTKHRRPEDWNSVLALAADPRPYKSAEELASHVNSYLHLLAIVPEELLESVTPSTFLTLLTRDSHNSFGIRSLDDEGDEYFGYGVWPAASYYNHSCDPNIAKQRTGRIWSFVAARDVREGEELCISYLNDEERDMSRGRRIQRLKKFWGFECQCQRCTEL